jgi:hypothetical protein
MDLEEQLTRKPKAIEPSRFTRLDYVLSFLFSCSFHSGVDENKTKKFLTVRFLVQQTDHTATITPPVEDAFYALDSNVATIVLFSPWASRCYHAHCGLCMSALRFPF